MNRIAYTYTVLRYIHDPVVGESMNVGVLVYAPAERFVSVAFETTYSRLSAAFAGFDGTAYREALRSFRRAVASLQAYLERGVLDPRQTPTDAVGVVQQFWPDRYLSFRSGELLGGVAHDLNAAVREIFDRFVASQFVRKLHERRDERQLWETLRTKFKPAALEQLRPATLDSKYVQYTFEHTFTNQRLHVVEPVSFDYADATSIIETATKWRGRLDILSDNPVARTGKFHFLVGKPKPSHRTEAEKAKGILLDSDVDAEVIDERQAPAFADEFSNLVLQHV
jgi:Protein of unknown function (DUF3037)